MLKEYPREFMIEHFHPLYINRCYKKKFGYKIDWNNPKDINEKMQWLNCFSDTTLWSRCADKLAVRDYIKEKGFENILVKLYGTWDDAEQIDFDILPDKFVLKCNHDSGSYFIIDKSKGFDKQLICRSLNEHLKNKYGYTHGELYYNKIKPCIIAEEYLEEKENIYSSSLIDYKFWCFDGKPYSIMVYSNRTKDYVYKDIYDLDWISQSEKMIVSNHFRAGNDKIPKPKTFDQMINISAVLSKGFPEVRIDFYEVNSKLYFGEMTFMTSAGFIDNLSKDYLLELGSQCKLPNKK